MLLEEERVKYNKLSHQLSLAQHAAEERAAEHIATLGLVENQKQEIARLQSDVLNLQQEVQVRALVCLISLFSRVATAL